MSTENLKDFYESNQFNRKLRKRIDGFEPELSDSLWDRIEHDLNKKEHSSRKVLWLVYTLGGLLLISGAGIFYLLDQNKRLASGLRPSAQEQIVVATPDQPKSGSNGTITPVPEKAGSGSQNTELPGRLSQSTTETFESAQTTTSPVVTDHTNENAITTTGNTPGREMGQEVITEVSVVTEVADIESLSLKNLGQTEITVVPSAAGPQAVKAKRYTAVPPVTFFVSAQGGVSRTTPGMATNTMLSPLEKTTDAWQKGLDAGILLKNKWMISSGVNLRQTAQRYAYKLERKIDLQNVTPGGAAERYDSIMGGDSLSYKNVQNWIEIPVMLGYKYALNGRWSLVGQVGLSYAMIRDYEGRTPNRYLRMFDETGASNPVPFRNHFNLVLNTGIAYQMNRNFALNVGADYRQALQSISNQKGPNYPERRPRALGGRVGITYTFK